MSDEKNYDGTLTNRHPILMNGLTLIIKGLSLLIIGFGIGWLMGLSVAPVVSGILTTLLTAVMTLVGILSGIEGKRDESSETGQVPNLSPRWAVNPVPVAILILGIFAGSSVGIFARTHNWLGGSEDISKEVKTWTDQGLEQPNVAQRLFDAKYPKDGTTSDGTTPPVADNSTGDSATTTVLFSNSQDECKSLLTLPPKDLPIYIKGTSFKELSTLIEDAEKLQKVLEVVCTKFGQ